MLFRLLIFTHRYLGIAIGWLMLLWCVSGMVMLYHSYPELLANERQAALSTLNLRTCCVFPADLYTADTAIADVAVEMFNQQPLLHIEPDIGPGTLIDLQSGRVIEAIDEQAALAVAQQFLLSSGLPGRPVLLGVIDHDQWTIYPRYDNARPLYHLALNDAAGTQVYVSGIDGRLVQKTARQQRFWNWLGAVPHWLYFTALRQHPAVWTQLVIYSSLLGTFVAAFGLYLGIWQLCRNSDGRWHSPYRGWKYWHHVSGLLFGVLLLTWVVSGLLSMNPWGWLETRGEVRDARTLGGELPTWQTVMQSLNELPNATLPADLVRIVSSVMNGRLNFIVSTRSADRSRLDQQWMAAPLSTTEAQALGKLLGATRVELLNQEDAYYYSHGRERVTLPVLRLQQDDAAATRYYLDPISGELLSKVDRNARWYRWLHSGLHRLDFAAVLRISPLHDLLIWLLLGGATVVCGSGVWLGIRHLRGP